MRWWHLCHLRRILPILLSIHRRRGWVDSLRDLRMCRIKRLCRSWLLSLYIGLSGRRALLLLLLLSLLLLLLLLCLLLLLSLLLLLRDLGLGIAVDRSTRGGLTGSEVVMGEPVSRGNALGRLELQQALEEVDGCMPSQHANTPGVKPTLTYLEQRPLG